MKELKNWRLLLKAWPVLGILLIEGILFLAHWFIYFTLIVFWAHLGPPTILILKGTLFPLAFTFVVAALLSFRFGNRLVRTLYKIAAVWLGFLNFFFFAACFCWVVWLVLQLSEHRIIALTVRPKIAACCFAVAFLVGIYGLANAYRIRVRRVSIKLPNLPVSWRGRAALLISDLHLGHINGARFARRIAALAAGLQPDIVLLPGDVFDGSKVEAEPLVAPFRQVAPPQGIFFATGNHDEFGDTPHFLDALRGVGIRVLKNEMVVVDGLQIIGVSYHDTMFPIRLRATLLRLQIDTGCASILLSHVPNRLPIAEEAGVSLQLSGHTHGGQFVPFTWLTRRVFGKFTHGLHRFGALQVYTSYGAGTWGPPMRVGTCPEVVLLQFE
jgi:predicted MPP superfamily phosphohydrolase